MHRSVSEMSVNSCPSPEVSWASIVMLCSRGLVLSPSSPSTASGVQVADRPDVVNPVGRVQLSLNFSPSDNSTFTLTSLMRLMVSLLAPRAPRAVKSKFTSSPAAGRKSSTDSRSASLLLRMCRVAPEEEAIYEYTFLMLLDNNVSGSGEKEEASAFMTPTSPVVVTPEWRDVLNINFSEAPPGGKVPTSHVNLWSVVFTVSLPVMGGVREEPKKEKVPACKSSSRNDTVTPVAVAVPLF